MPLHHLRIGTWTPPGAIFTVQFDDELLELKLVKRTEIPHDEPISWMAFDVSSALRGHLHVYATLLRAATTHTRMDAAHQKESLRFCHEEMV